MVRSAKTRASPENPEDEPETDPAMPHSATPQPSRAPWSIPRLAMLVTLVLGAASGMALASPTDYSRESRRFEKAMRDQDRDARDRAIERFAGLTDPRIVADLVEEAARRLERCGELDRLEARLVSDLDDLERRSAQARMRQRTTTNPSRAAAAAARERELRRELDALRTEREGHRSTYRRAIHHAADVLDSLEDAARADALAAIVRAARDRRQLERAVSAIEVLGCATLEDACTTLTELVTNDRSMIRSAAVRACANRCVNDTGTSSVDAALRDALGDSDWTIRATAIEAIACRPDPDTIEALAEAANREPGRLAEDAAAALEFASSRSAPDRSSGADAKEAIPRTAHRYGASFYGISTCSRRLVIVLDTSGSMDERAATGEASKLEVAKRELVRTLNELREPAVFNLVFFGDVVTTWRPDLVELDAKSRADAIAFTEAATAGGGTNLSGALRAAFAAGDGPAGGVDTIFILSDGRPNRGDRLEPDEILRDIVHRHAERRVRIHAIGLGHEHNAELMQGLAEQTGGCYIVRR